jgi:hypothetical protein
MSSAEKSEENDSHTVNSHSHSQTLALLNTVDTWSDSQEKLLKAIAERSNCMRWLHMQCTGYFENLNFYFTIPNIIISTLNGSITMSLTSLFPDVDTQQTATTIIGLVSIFSAVLITMNQYLKSQQMTEAHHSAGLSYAKLYRSILNELSLRRDQRSNGLEFLKHVRSDIDRLESTAPTILPFAIKEFNKKFANRNIEKPEITGDLDEVEINKDANTDVSTDLNTQKALPNEPVADEITTITLKEKIEKTEEIEKTEKTEKKEKKQEDISSIIQEYFAVNELKINKPVESTNVIVDMGDTIDSEEMNYTMTTEKKYESVD